MWNEIDIMEKIRDERLEFIQLPSDEMKSGSRLLSQC
jgi:hypothetical protein